MRCMQVLSVPQNMKALSIGKVEEFQRMSTNSHISNLMSHLNDFIVCLFELLFYGPVNLLRSCQAQSFNLSTVPWQASQAVNQY